MILEVLAAAGAVLGLAIMLVCLVGYVWTLRPARLVPPRPDNVVRLRGRSKLDLAEEKARTALQEYHDALKVDSGRSA